MKYSSSTTLSIESRQGIYGICCFPYLACLGCFPLRLKDTIRLTWLFMGKKKAWWATPLYLFWTIWKERNSKSFENEEHFVQGLKHSFAVINGFGLSCL